MPRVLSFALLLALAAPGFAQTARKAPREQYEALNALRLEASAVYRIGASERIELRRGDALMTFDEGKLAFFTAYEGQVTGAVFSGRGHALAAPRDPGEKQQMARFLAAPVLDQDFSSAFLRFTDGTADELVRQFRQAGIAPEEDRTFTSGWNESLAQLSPVHSLRLLFEKLSPSPRHFFHASLDGAATGLFDVLLDDDREEPFLLGQTRKIGAAVFFDTWASYRPGEGSPPPAPFRAVRYRIETTVLPDNSLEGTTAVLFHAETEGPRILALQLSRTLAIESVTNEAGALLDHFQNEGMNLQERNARGNDILYVLLPEGAQQGREFTLRFRYHGNVIEDAGNGVLFVGAHESWYPHLGDAAGFAEYEMKMRWPRKLRLVATGSKIDERDEGEMRTATWKPEKPVSVVGFNLGDYLSAAQAAGEYSVEVFANRHLEQALNKRLSAPGGELAGSLPTPFGQAAAASRLNLPMAAPSPTDTLKQLSREILSSIRFYEKYSGAFPFRNLSVSQIPGTFGQGWPGLLYVSTLSFLPAEAQRRAGLTSSGQEHFTELVPFHEVAHQWWGNIVGWSSYRDQWIDESIANYLALMFADSQKNPDHTLRVWLARYRQRLTEKPAEGQEAPSEMGSLEMGRRLSSSRSPSGFETVIYGRGAWIFHMVREMLRQRGAKDPDARFAQFLETLSSKYAYRALSTRDLQRELERVMTPAMDLEGGHSMEWFFEEWVRGTGIPRYRVEFSAKPTEKGFAVRGRLLQSEVPKSFIASVPLYATSGGRDVFLGNVVATGPETSFHFVTAALPRKIRIDPQMTLLAVAE